VIRGLNFNGKLIFSF